MSAVRRENAMNKNEFRFLGTAENKVSGQSFPYVPKQETFLLLFVRSGTGDLDLGNQHRHITPGALFILRFGIPCHVTSRAEPLTLTEFWIEGIPTGLPSFCHIISGSDADTLVHELAASDPSQSADALRQLLLTLKADRATANHPVPDYLESFKDILDNRFAEHLNLNRFSEELHRNKFRLAKEFKAAFGIPPIEYLMNRRMQEAVRLLLQTDRSITEIGCAVGMDNIPYFIRTFRQRIGSTPGNFRKNHPIE